MAFTVPFQEMYGYPRGRWKDGVFTAERRLLIPWQSRQQFLIELSQYPNFLYPYDEGPQIAIVRSAETIPYADSNAAAESSYASYNWCIVRLLHSSDGAVWDTNYGAYFEEEILHAGMNVRLPTNKMTWASDGKSIDDYPLNLDLPLYEYVLKVKQLGTLPAWVLSRPGTVNSNPITTPVFGTLVFGPYTCRYNGCNIRASYVSAGIAARAYLQYDMTASFLIKESRWDRYFRAETQTWEAINTPSGTFQQYTPASYGILM